MEEAKDKATTGPRPIDIPSLVRQVAEEFTRAQQAKTEPAYKTELQEERKRREQLERRVNDLVEENKRSRQVAEEAERSATIRAELQRLGVGKVDLAFKAVKDDIGRAEDGRLVGKTESGDLGLKEYLAGFVSSNPEFLPARIAGGSGIPSAQKETSVGGAGVDLDKIRPGMDPQDLERARQEIARIASRALQGS
ncbi:MAG TPA: hypothetical protein VK335_20565 [Bryobacteraceae bacterium]|nr:hypothetical protein [Bryobacteraceae bacterium]